MGKTCGSGPGTIVARRRIHPRAAPARSLEASGETPPPPPRRRPVRRPRLLVRRVVRAVPGQVLGEVDGPRLPAGEVRPKWRRPDRPGGVRAGRRGVRPARPRRGRIDRSGGLRPRPRAALGPRGTDAPREDLRPGGGELDLPRGTRAGLRSARPRPKRPLRPRGVRVPAIPDRAGLRSRPLSLAGRGDRPGRRRRDVLGRDGGLLPPLRPRRERPARDHGAAAPREAPPGRRALAAPTGTRRPTSPSRVRPEGRA